MSEKEAEKFRELEHWEERWIKRENVRKQEIKQAKQEVYDWLKEQLENHYVLVGGKDKCDKYCMCYDIKKHLDMVEKK